jgi:uncharacterized protein (TIGR02270 family)
MIVQPVAQQHADDAAFLAMQRLRLLEGPEPRLEQLLRLDRRLAANLDGLRLAGEDGRALTDAALVTPSSGAVFAVAAERLQARDTRRLELLLALVESVPETYEGLLAAFTWVERGQLSGIVAALLGEQRRWRRAFGMAVCAAHRVDPHIAQQRWVEDADPLVRARALQAAGELGLRELVSSCVASMADDEPHVQFWAAWSAVLLGDREHALNALIAYGLSRNSFRARSFRLALQATELGTAHTILQRVAPSDERSRRLIEGSGIAGDPAYVSWLLKEMQEPTTARLAGEAFTLITGVNLGPAALDRPAPENYEPGPNGDPDEQNVDVDPDDGLPWPDHVRIQRWWSANANRYTKGIRYFMGAPLSVEHCSRVLKTGYQRQRILAAHYLCLLQPGTTLFNTSSPAARQQRLLAAMP